MRRVMSPQTTLACFYSQLSQRNLTFFLMAQRKIPTAAPVQVVHSEFVSMQYPYDYTYDHYGYHYHSGWTPEYLEEHRYKKHRVNFTGNSY
jgi:hypothetical protein